MRVALCLSGFPRTMEYTYPYLKKYIIDELNPDIFFFGYEDEHSNKEKIQTLYKTSARVAREYTPEVEEEIWEAYGTREIKNTQISTAPINILSQWYNIFKCNELKSKHESKNNFIYDIVIRARTDYYFFRKLEEQELALATPATNVCTPDVWDFKSVNKHAITDFFAFGNSKSMDTYSNLFNRAAEYNLKHNFIFHPESMMGYNLHIEQIERRVVSNNFWLELDDFWKNPDKDVTHCYIEGLIDNPPRK